MKMTVEELIASLTIEDAREYEAEVEKIMWIEDGLLDPNDLPRSHFDRVENALIKILKSAK
jgi:hypothetical protein